MCPSHTAPSEWYVTLCLGTQYGESMGYIDISLDDKTHHVVSWEASLVELDESVPFDNATAEILRKAEELSLEERVVGTALGTFGCPETEFALLIGVSTCSRFGESEIGNLVADAILQYARGLGASVALMNGGGIRSIIGQGNITDKQARAVVPFPNTISVIRVTGKTLGAALNNSLSRIDSENGTGRLLQVSGVRMKFDMARDPEERVFDVETLTPDGWWSPLHEDSVYTVALPDFVRNGGDGYNMFANDALEAIDYGPTLITILVKYIEDRHPTPGVRPVLHGRLVNATVGAAPGVYGCVTSRVVVNASGLVGDGCDGIRKRSYTHAVLKIEPSQQDHVAVLLRLRVDSRWLLPFNASEIHPDGSHDVRMEIVTGDKARDNSGFNYDTRCAPPPNETRVLGRVQMAAL